MRPNPGEEKRIKGELLGPKAKCANCKHWNTPQGEYKERYGHVGYCGLGSPWNGAYAFEKPMVITTDLTVCSKWERNE